MAPNLPSRRERGLPKRVGGDDARRFSFESAHLRARTFYRIMYKVAGDTGTSEGKDPMRNNEKKLGEVFAVVWQDFGILLSLSFPTAEEAKEKAIAMNARAVPPINARPVHLSAENKLTFLDEAQQ